MRIDLSPLKQLSGFIGAAVVDSETGLVLGRLADDSRDMDLAAAGATDVVHAARRVAQSLEADEDLEDVFMSFGTQYHLARTVGLNPAILLYLWLDRRTANFGLARITLKQVEEAIAI